eukprot:192025-Pyramimonas_sp.AAC.1
MLSDMLVWGVRSGYGNDEAGMDGVVRGHGHIMQEANVTQERVSRFRSGPEIDIPVGHHTHD